MPMRGDPLSVVSRCGEWRASLKAVLSGALDPSRCSYEFAAWDADCDDPVLFARTDDGTGRIATTGGDGVVLLAWCFPAEEMCRLALGSHTASITAVLGEDEDEVKRFVFVTSGEAC